MNIPDTVGYATPQHMGKVIIDLKNRVPNIDQAIKMIDGINDYLRQDISETVGFQESIDQLNNLLSNDG